MNIRDLGALALTLTVAGFIIAFALMIQSDLSSEMCPSNSTYQSGTAVENSTTVNAETGTRSGCCSLVTSEGAGANCTSWAYSAAFNASQQSISGVAEFSGWFGLIAMALVFAIIIGVVVKHIGGAGQQNNM